MHFKSDQPQPDKLTRFYFFLLFPLSNLITRRVNLCETGVPVWSIFKVDGQQQYHETGHFGDKASRL